MYIFFSVCERGHICVIRTSQKFQKRRAWMLIKKTSCFIRSTSAQTFSTRSLYLWQYVFFFIVFFCEYFPPNTLWWHFLPPVYLSGSLELVRISLNIVELVCTKAHDYILIFSAGIKIQHILPTHTCMMNSY